MVARAIQSVLSERPGWTGARSGLARRELDRASQWGLWALPAWTVLLFLGTLTHQPDTRTDFAGFARYVTCGGAKLGPKLRKLSPGAK